MEHPLRAFARASAGNSISSFTPLERPAINDWNNINKTSIPNRKGEVKAPTR
jgi:hypothetical protein